MIDGDLSRVNWPHVHEDALRRRLACYLSQTSKEMKGSVNLTSAIMLDIGNDMDLNDINELIRGNVRNEDGWHLPKNMDVEDFREHLAHIGSASGTSGCNVSLSDSELSDFPDRPVKGSGMKERGGETGNGGTKTLKPKPYDRDSLGNS